MEPRFNHSTTAPPPVHVCVPVYYS